MPEFVWLAVTVKDAVLDGLGLRDCDCEGVRVSLDVSDIVALELGV